MIFEENQCIKLQDLPISFIYFLLRENQVVYIGQTKIGPGRIYTHLKTKCFDEIYVMPCESDKLDEMEGYYIEKYMPIYNRCPNQYFSYSIPRVIKELKSSTKLTKRKIDILMKNHNLVYMEFNGVHYIKHDDYQILSNIIMEESI